MKTVIELDIDEKHWVQTALAEVAARHASEYDQEQHERAEIIYGVLVRLCGSEVEAKELVAAFQGVSLSEDDRTGW